MVFFFGGGGLYHIVKVCFDVPEECTVKCQNEMLLHDVKTSNMTIIWITVAVKIKKVAGVSNMSIKIDYKCFCKLYMEGSVSQLEKLGDCENL